MPDTLVHFMYAGDQTLMQVIGDKNQISEDVFDFMISYLPFHQKSSVLNLVNFFHQYRLYNLVETGQIQSFTPT